MKTVIARLAASVLGIVLVGIQIAAGQAPARITVPAGTRILVRLTDAIDSSKQKAGFRFAAALETNLQADDVVVAPRGTTVYGKLVNAESAGSVSGGGAVTLELTDILISGTAVPLMTTTYEVRSEGQGEQSATRILGGAGLGALIGGIAGGGTGAAIGAAVGGGAGVVASAATPGEQVQLPSESLVEFRLDQPVTISMAH